MFCYKDQCELYLFLLIFFCPHQEILYNENNGNGMCYGLNCIFLRNMLKS